MPLLRASASDVTATVKASAQVNAAVGGASYRGGNSAPPPAGGAAAGRAVVTQSAVAKSGSSTFSLLRMTPTVIPPVPVVPPTPIALATAGFGQEDVFLIKTNTAGVALWSARISSSVSEFGFGVAVAPSGDVYVTGQLRTSASAMTAFNWDGTAFPRTLTNTSGDDAFIVKYSGGGLVRWVAKVASAGTDIGSGITVGSDESVYITGRCGTGVVLHNADGTTLATSGLSGGFVAKYNANGFGQWMASISGGDIGSCNTDSLGNLYVAGESSSSPVTIYNSNATTALTLPNVGGSMSIVIKYNSSGTVQWAARQSSVGLDSGYAMTVDSDGNVYVGGRYQNNAITIFNAGTSGSEFATLANSGSDDVFLAKYNSSGAVQWCARLESAGIDIAFCMTSDPSGNVYIGGSYGAVLTARNSSGEAFGTTIAQTGTTANSFLAKYTPSGAVEWLTRMNSSTTGSYLQDVSTDSLGNIYATGFFEGQISVFSQGATTAAFSTTGVGGNDTFLVKYNSSGVVQWLLRRASAALDRAFAVAADSAGNTFQTGVFAGPMALGTIVA
jgi:hypothetical protein